MLITKDPGIARHAEKCGVDVIFIDLETGVDKQQRQKGRNAVNNDHTLADIMPVRAVLEKAELMVRVNALNSASANEVDLAIEAGADCLMLPMFANADDIKRFRDLVDGRVRIRPLIETPDAVSDAANLAELDGIDSYHFGLNDLHIAWGYRFVFEPLIYGRLDAAIAEFREAGIDFGIGGMAQIAEGDVTGAEVLSEYIGHQSNRVILSRTFHRNAANMDELQSVMDLKEQVDAVREHCRVASKRGQKEIDNDHERFVATVSNIATKLSAR